MNILLLFHWTGWDWQF